MQEENEEEPEFDHLRMASIIAGCITASGVCGLFVGSVFCLRSDPILVVPYMTEEQLRKIDAMQASSTETESE